MRAAFDWIIVTLLVLLGIVWYAEGRTEVATLAIIAASNRIRIMELEERTK